MTTTETDNLPALPEPEAVDLMAPLGLPSPSEWGALGGMAEQLSRSRLVPAALRGKPDDVMLVLLVGRDLRLQPTQALFKIHVIEGKPTMSAELQAGIVNRQPGMSIWPDPANDHTKATAHGSRDGREFSFSFTLKDAERANLAGKGNWRTWPQFMLWARAVSGLCRMAFSDVLCGVAYTPEELGAEVDPQTGEVLDVPSRPAEESPFLSEANVKAVIAKAEAAGLYPEAIEEMVGMATNERTYFVAEVRKDEVAALRDAMQAMVERYVAPPADDTPSVPDDEPLASLALFAELTPKVKALVDPASKAKAGTALKSLIPALKRLGVETDDDQRAVLSTLLGRQVHSRAELTASESAAVVAVLDEEGAG